MVWNEKGKTPWTAKNEILRYNTYCLEEVLDEGLAYWWVLPAISSFAIMLATITHPHLAESLAKPYAIVLGMWAILYMAIIQFFVRSKGLRGEAEALFQKDWYSHQDFKDRYASKQQPKHGLDRAHMLLYMAKKNLFKSWTVVMIKMFGYAMIAITGAETFIIGFKLLLEHYSFQKPLLTEVYFLAGAIVVLAITTIISHMSIKRFCEEILSKFNTEEENGGESLLQK